MALPLSLPPLLQDPLISGEGFGEDVPFRAEGSEVSFCLHTVCLWVSAFFSTCFRGGFKDALQPAYNFVLKLIQSGVLFPICIMF